MKKVFAFLLVALATNGIWGQTDTAVDSVQERYVELSQEYSKHPDNVLNLMAMADFFSDAGNPYYSLTQAAEYAQKAEELYTAWVLDKKKYNDLQKLIRKGITIPVIRQKRKEIESQAVLYVRSHVPQMDVAEAAAYTDVFSNNAEIVKRLQSKMVAEAFVSACRENSIEGYYDFCRAYPNTPEADSAELLMSRLCKIYFSRFDSEEAVDAAAARYAGSALLQQAAMMQKSRIAFLAASRVNTAEAYSAYISRYPRGEHYIEAVTRLHQLGSMDYDMLTTPEQLAHFAESNSDDPLADSALAKLRHMMVNDCNQEAARIYLSEFQLDEHYSEAYRQYYERYSAEGNGQPIRDFIEAHPDYPYRLAVSSDLERAAIIDSVDLTKPFVESDFDTMTTSIRQLTGRKVAFVALQRILQRQIAAKDWSGAKKRMQKFDICFEEVSANEYDELSRLLSDNAPTSAQLEMPADDISHLVAHPDNKRLYFSYSENGRPSIGYARKVTGKKGSSWKFVGMVEVEGCTSEAVPYSFYDKGHRVLLGINNDIWSAQVVSDTLWQLEEHFGTPLNTPYLEQDAFMLEDGTGMLLVSDRPGGVNVQKSGSYYHGDNAPAFDIYFVPMRDSSHWGEAVNLGVRVNTPYCERNPILSRNMRTLYYVTDARGLGYGDIYRATRDNIDDWTHWSAPVNMGRGVNGAFEEASLSFGDGEMKVYYTSAVQHQGRNVCCSFTTRHDTSGCFRQVSLKLDSVIDVMGNVSLVDVRRQQLVEDAQTGEMDTMMTYRLYKNKKYALLFVTRWVYVPSVIIDGRSPREIVVRPYTLEQLKARTEALPLPMVGFYDNTSRMLPLSFAELDGLARFLRQHPGCRVEIEVHVNGTDDRRCYELSFEQATAIRSYLAECGVDSDNIRLVSFGNVRYKKGQMPSPVAIRFY